MLMLLNWKCGKPRHTAKANKISKCKSESDKAMSAKLIEILFQMRTLTWFSWKAMLHPTNHQNGCEIFTRQQQQQQQQRVGESALAGILWNGYEKQANARTTGRNARFKRVSERKTEREGESGGRELERGLMTQNSAFVKIKKFFGTRLAGC